MVVSKTISCDRAMRVQLQAAEGHKHKGGERSRELEGHDHEAAG